jgi:hypothetical protein
MMLATNASTKCDSFYINVSVHSQRRLCLAISSSDSAANQRHLLTMCGSTLKAYLELASRRRSRFLTIVADMWCRSKFTSRSPSTAGASTKAGFWEL